MKKRYLSLIFLPIITLTSCLNFRTKISKEEFINSAKNTTSENFNYASIKCSAILKSVSAENKNANRDEKINRTFKYCFLNSKWAKDSTVSTKDFSSTEKTFFNQFTVYLSNDIKVVIKNEPFTFKSEDGLICYKNDLAYRYKIRYKDYKSTMESNGVQIDTVTNGTMIELISFNAKNGRITSYYEKDDLSTKYTSDGTSMTVNDYVEVSLKISYSNIRK